MKKLLLFIILIFIFNIDACLAAVNIDYDALAMLESGNNPAAISYKGKNCGIGLYQISLIQLKQYNNYHSKKYNQSDLFNPSINYKIAKWSLEIDIPRQLKYYKVNLTLDNILRAYNMGCKGLSECIYNNRKMSSETKNYYNKYKNFLN